jgi:hypothetical protein
VADELLGMPGRNLQINSQIFPLKMIRYLLFLVFLRFRRLYLTSVDDLRSWGFFGGSIDPFKYSGNFQ